MTDSEFIGWAVERGVPYETAELLLMYAATVEEMQAASDAMEPAPPVYPLTDIVEMTDTDPYEISAHKNGFVLIGGCPNGDPIAIDVADEPGTIWYICHETMNGNPLREESVRVAMDLAGLFESECPLDYFDAKDRADEAGN